MTARVEFYQSHLDRVSRSFAFCIRQLPLPLREWVGLSYLLCRVVDTIEDATWAEAQLQFDAFALFDRALLDQQQVVGLETWERVFESAQVKPDERNLLKDAAQLMADYHRFPAGVRELMRELIHTMSQGMQHFCRTKKDGPLRLSNLAEVNQYCFFVAGLVGELLAKLVARAEPRFQVSQAVLLKAYHFGLFLQKVNLLKDQVGDEREGRHLIPSRELVEDSSRENALSAFEFLLALPKEQLEFRRFCAWSLFLGLEALGVARRSLKEHRVLKVSRGQTQELLSSVEVALSDDSRLQQLFHGLLAKLGWGGLSREASDAVMSSQQPEWFAQLCHGRLESGSLAQLGV